MALRATASARGVKPFITGLEAFLRAEGDEPVDPVFDALLHALTE